MKKVGCKDLGMATCNFVAEGETDGEVKGKIWAHAKEVHADELAKMSNEEKKGMNVKIDSLLSE